MLKNFAAVLFSAFLLSGCVLQSEVPNFANTEGKFLLGEAGGTYQLSVKENEIWKADGEAITFVRSGKNYTFKNEKNAALVKFIPLIKTWWIAQFQDGKKESVYVLIDAQSDALYLHVLTCDDLKVKLPSAVYIKHRKDECHLQAGTKAESLIPLVATAGARTNKWILKK